MIKLTKHQVLQMHESLIKQFGGMGGIRDEGLLDAALSTPFQSFSGEDLFPTLQAKAARLAYGLVKNHALLDGNKRLGAKAETTFNTYSHLIPHKRDDVAERLQKLKWYHFSSAGIKKEPINLENSRFIGSLHFTRTRS